MRPARYPLAAVRLQRDEARKAAHARLGVAQREWAEAQAALDAVSARREGLRAMRSASVNVERPGIAQSAAEIARSGAYAARLGREQKQVDQQLSAAARALAERARAVRLAELALSEAHVQRELIERHHARFQEEQRKLSDRKEELEVEDLHRTRVPRFSLP